MNKRSILNMFTLMSILTLTFTSDAHALNQIAATTDMVEIAAFSIRAKADLSEVALTGDLVEIAQANRRSDAVDAVLDQSKKAFSEMEHAEIKDNDKVAQSAAVKLKEGTHDAQEAFEKTMPESENVEMADQQKKVKKEVSIERVPFYLPNIYNSPSHPANRMVFEPLLFGSSDGSDILDGYGGLGYFLDPTATTDDRDSDVTPE